MDYIDNNQIYHFCLYEGQLIIYDHEGFRYTVVCSPNDGNMWTLIQKHIVTKTMRIVSNLYMLTLVAYPDFIIDAVIEH